MRTLIAVALAALAAGCGSSPGPWLETGVDESLAQDPLPVNAELPQFDPSMYEHMTTFTLGTEQRPPAKTIDWAVGGVAEGTTFMKGKVSVKTVQRNDADDFYGVSLLLRNHDERALAVEWTIAFFDAAGKRRIGLNDYRGWEPVYRSSVIEPFGRLSVSNACRVKGARTFKLYVRAKGDAAAGEPDAGTLEKAVVEAAPAPEAAAPGDDDLLENIGR